MNAVSTDSSSASIPDGQIARPLHVDVQSSTMGASVGERVSAEHSSTEFDAESISVPTIVPFPPPPTREPRDVVRVLRDWEGVVESVDEDHIVARVVDRRDPSVRELVEIDFDQIARDDRELVETGAVFYWTIGRQTSHTGAVRNLSEIRFRRLPTWSGRDFRRANDHADRLAALFE